jgi:alpha-methylacyl-CoA racemase
MAENRGPLTGIRIVEFAGIGPAPFAVMLLADMGASVVRIERAGSDWPDVPIVSRGRASLILDLRSPGDLTLAREAIAAADVLVEGFRPGAMERLGLGPEDAAAVNPRLIYGRMTGWGQTGPRSGTAGHDINYIAVSGMLWGIGGRAPLNLLGDYAGGGAYLVMGILAALFERESSGVGQIVDAAIVDGAASMMAPILGMMAAGVMASDPSRSILAGNAPYYRTYRCSDGGLIAAGPLEPRFRRVMTDALGLAPGAADSDGEALEQLFLLRSRAEWASLFDNTDACVSPVLDVREAADDPHLKARGTYLEGAHGLEPAPAPRFSRTPSTIAPGEDGRARLRAWGVDSPLAAAIGNSFEQRP